MRMTLNDLFSKRSCKYNYIHTHHGWYDSLIFLFFFPSPFLFVIILFESFYCTLHMCYMWLYVYPNIASDWSEVGSRVVLSKIRFARFQRNKMQEFLVKIVDDLLRDIDLYFRMAEIIDVFRLIHSTKITNFIHNWRAVCHWSRYFRYSPCALTEWDRRSVNIFSCAIVWDSKNFIHTIGALNFKYRKQNCIERSLRSVHFLSLTHSSVSQCVGVGFQCQYTQCHLVHSRAGLCASLFCPTYATNRKRTHSHTQLFSISDMNL